MQIIINRIEDRGDLRQYKVTYISSHNTHFDIVFCCEDEFIAAKMMLAYLDRLEYLK